MIKKMMFIVKKICFAFLFLYGINVVLSSLDIFIPINLSTIATVSLLGIPGYISLFAIHMIIK